MTVPPEQNICKYEETDNTNQRVEIGFNNVMDQFKEQNVPMDLAIVLLPVKGSPLYGNWFLLIICESLQQ